MRHGLGTGAWLDGDATIPSARPSRPFRGGVGADLGTLPRDLVVSNETAKVGGASSAGWGVESWHEVRISGAYSFRVLDSGIHSGCPDSDAGLAPPPVVFLHGFMGGAEDWNAILGGGASGGAWRWTCCHGRSRFVHLEEGWR